MTFYPRSANNKWSDTTTVRTEKGKQMRLTRPFFVYLAHQYVHDFTGKCNDI